LSSCPDGVDVSAIGSRNGHADSDEPAPAVLVLLA